SPGPCTPQDAGISIDLVTAAALAPTPIPLLGVCLGHQAIGAAFGATIVRADLPMHGKVSRITHEGIGLFDGLPGAVDVTRYHSLTIDPYTLSDELQVTARAPDGMIMGVQHRDLPIHGVQFHPESIRTVTGHDMLANFLTLAGLPVRRRNAPVPHSATTDRVTQPQTPVSHL
ncbi:MAG: aminodeoxychorismate/anthranilate synthase component II, partial [Pseudomonadota bacterium]